jgi:phosphotransferase system enzyme I (PtsI)
MINAQLQHPKKPARSETTTIVPEGEKRIKGTSVAPGTGMGRPCFFSKHRPDYSGEEVNGAYLHQSIVRNAFDRVQEQLSVLAAKAEGVLDSRTADIFRTHGMICEEINTRLFNDPQGEQRISIEYLEKVFDDYSRMFNELEDDYIKDRAGDFEELKKLLLDTLDHGEACLSCRDQSGCAVGECELQNPHIIVADELTAGVAIRIKEITKGIVVDRCGINSHAAVIARSLKVPVISGIKEPLELTNINDTFLIDGTTGELFIGPGKSTISRYDMRINTPPILRDAVDPVPEFEVCADIELCGDIDSVIRAKADGVGLYRTEFEVLAKGGLLSEQEQIERYQNVVQRMAGKPVYVRLFDLGSDKAASCLDLKEEINPALGCRGARLLLANPELLKVQARALAMASQGSLINVIYPMISSLAQFLRLKALFLASIAGIEHTQLAHGVMIEVPSLCENAEALFDVIDFARVGSGDLVQYLYAFDRSRDDFCYDELVNDPAIWNILRHLVEVAGKAEKSLGICGALVEDHRFIAKLMDMGITTISTRPENIAAIRNVAMESLTFH